MLGETSKGSLRYEADTEGALRCKRMPGICSLCHLTRQKIVLGERSDLGKRENAHDISIFRIESNFSLIDTLRLRWNGMIREEMADQWRIENYYGALFAPNGEK